MSKIWDYCHVCGKPIMVGDKCFKVGYRTSDQTNICEKCNQSIKPYDTIAAYKEYAEEYGDD